MKILVYGAGVQGSLIAARLQEAGQNVSILARGQRLADLRTYGNALQDALTGDRMTMQMNVVEQLSPEDAYDFVIVIVRRNQIPAVLPVLAANQHTPNVLFLGNNAAGPSEYVSALGRTRVLFGFAGTGGVREGQAIRYLGEVGNRKAKITLGELDGNVTPRVNELTHAFESAGFVVTRSSNIDAWLKTHAAVVVPIALALYMVGGSNYRLAHTRDALVLGLRALREGFRALHALNIPITPPTLRVYEWVPEPLLIPVLQRLFDSKYAEIGMAGHANAARDEMQELATEFQKLIRATDVPTPAWDWLYRYADPSVPIVAAGSQKIPLDWRGVMLALGVGAGLFALARLMRSRCEEE